MNKERLKEQLKELIIEKYDEIKYLRHRLNNLEIKQMRDGLEKSLMDCK